MLLMAETVKVIIEPTEDQSDDTFLENVSDDVSEAFDHAFEQFRYRVEQLITAERSVKLSVTRSG